MERDLLQLHFYKDMFLFMLNWFTHAIPSLLLRDPSIQSLNFHHLNVDVSINQLCLNSTIWRVTFFRSSAHSQLISSSRRLFHFTKNFCKSLLDLSTWNLRLASISLTYFSTHLLKPFLPRSIPQKILLIIGCHLSLISCLKVYGFFFFSIL